MIKSIYLFIIIVSIIIKNCESIQPLILFNNDDNGINYEVLKADNKRIIITENTTKLHETSYKIKSLDFNWKGKYLLWSSAEYPYPIYLSEFKIKEIDENQTRFQITKRSIITGKNSQTKLAVDWVHNLVYYFKYNVLTVSDIQTPEVGYELTRKEDRELWKYTSGSIAVNPFDSFIVWTEYNTIDGIAVIRKCNEDGSGQHILVYRDIRLPVCLAIDFQTKSILWIDNELHSLSSIDFFGNNRKTLKQSKDLFNDCSDLDVFNDFIYWSSPKANKILKLNISGGADQIQEAEEEIVVISEFDIDFVTIVSPLQQQISTNYCENASCAHVCLPNSSQSYRCLCSDVPQIENCNETKIVFSLTKIPESKQNGSAISELLRSEEPLLLFTARKRDIRLTRLPENHSIYYIDSEFMYELDHYVSAIDFSLLGNFFVWLKTDSSIYTYLSKTTLFATPIDESMNNSLNIESMKLMINMSESSVVKTLAVDWIHNLAYFPLCEGFFTKGIFAMNLSNPEKLFQVIPQSTCVTKDIRVDPLESLIFWSEYKELTSISNPYSRYSSSSYSRNRNIQSNKYQIKKCLQDGQNEVLLMETQYIRKNSLTVDFVDKRIYWIEFRSYVNSLNSITYTGTDSKSVSLGMNIFDDVLTMDLFNDYIYWANNVDETIRKFNKSLTKWESHIVLQSGVDIDAIKIIHKSRQPIGTNKCLNSNCLHICLPTTTPQHNHTCYCPRGQEWNGQTCQSTGGKQITTTSATPTPKTTSNFDLNSFNVLDNEPKLLYVVYKEGIYVKPNLIDLNTNYIESIELRSNTNWITELDFSYAGNYLFWLESSVFEGFTLNAAPIDKRKPNSLSIINEKKIVSKSYNSKRMAFDWIHKLIYLGIPKGIEVYSIDDNVYNYEIVIHDEVQGDLAVDPIQGFIIWSQWRYQAITNQHIGKICRANQDGSDHSMIYEQAKIPNTLTLDFDTQSIYWIDTSLFSLNSINYLGNNFVAILMTRNLFDGSFSMDVFGEFIYWSNYDKNNILKTKKFGQNNTEKIVVINAYTDLEGIKVLDSSRQPNGTNKCQNANCSQLCLPVGKEYRCVCAKNRISLNTCTESNVVTIKTTTAPVLDTNAIPSASVDHSHYMAKMANISHKLDSLMNSTLAKIQNKESTNHHWIAIMLLSIAINLILIAIFIYRKKKMNPISKYILAKFQNDRDEIFLDERANDDL